MGANAAGGAKRDLKHQLSRLAAQNVNYTPSLYLPELDRPPKVGHSVSVAAADRRKSEHARTPTLMRQCSATVLVDRASMSVLTFGSLTNLLEHL